MLLKDFIVELKEIYDTFPADYLEIVGEPEIVIDDFAKIASKTFHRLFEYKGVKEQITIDRTFDGSLLVITPLTNRNDVNRIIKANIKK